jgi:hypothetical protein
VCGSPAKGENLLGGKVYHAATSQLYEEITENPSKSASEIVFTNGKTPEASLSPRMYLRGLK